MKKEFVTYEQALALKELGFDDECCGYYSDNILYIYEIENKNNSLTRTHATAKGLMEELIERPLTIQSFITYCYECGGIDVYHLFNGGKVDAEYRSVINYIRSKCASQQVEQALIGNYNAGLVQRLNSIKETIEIHEVQELPLINLPD